MLRHVEFLDNQIAIGITIDRQVEGAFLFLLLANILFFSLCASWVLLAFVRRKCLVV